MSPSTAAHRTYAMALILCAVAIQAAAQTTPYTPPPSPRVKLNFDLNWKFIRDDVAGAEALGFDDSSWTTVSTPHTFNDVDSFRQIISHSGGDRGTYKGLSWPAKAGGGPLYDIACHRIDLMNCLFGRPLRATGYRSTLVHPIAVEDNATVLIEHDSGLRGMVDVRWHSRVARDEFRIRGTDGEMDLTPLNAPALKFPGGAEEVPAAANLPTRASRILRVPYWKAAHRDRAAPPRSKPSGRWARCRRIYKCRLISGRASVRACQKITGRPPSVAALLPLTRSR